MNKSLQLIIRLLCVAAFLWTTPNGVRAEADVWDGTSKTKPNGWKAGDATLTISTAAELAWVAETANNGTVTGSGSETGFEGCAISLSCDIDLNDQDWTPIGTEDNPFQGNFDGNKKTIKNLTTSGQTTDGGLFGRMAAGSIKNLGVIISADGIAGIRSAGGLVGSIGSGSTISIEDCFVSGGPIKTVQSKDGEGAYTGGIVGQTVYFLSSTLTINRCYVAVSSIISYFRNQFAEACAGGFLGIDGRNSTIKNCLSFTKAITVRIDKEASVKSVGRIAGTSYYRCTTTFTDNYSVVKATCIEINYNGETTISFPNGEKNNKNGADLTIENFNGDAGNALAEWESAGWILKDGYLPKLSTDSPDISTDDYFIPQNNTSTNPYQIKDESDFLYYAYQINQNVTGFNNTEYFKLANDITLPSGWTPMGTTAHPFKGTFDGDNHTVSLSLKADLKQAQAGLFGTIDGGATVRKVAVNVVADGITSTASGAESRAGAIAAVNEGTIDQCYVSGEGFVLSSDGTNRHAGGIAGDNSGTISNCYNLIPVKVNDSSDSYLGGIAGHNTGKIEYCFAAGEVSIAADAVVSSFRDGTGDEIIGGIVGFNDHATAGVIKNCLAVNAKIPENAHRVIGTGGDADDVNNFSFHDMPRLITKSADVYDPQEGTPLTSSNLNSEVGGCFNGWNTSAWDLSSFNTLPKLQGFTSQPEKLIAPYLLHTIQIAPCSNGTLSVTRPDPLNGSEIAVNNNDQLPYNTVLTITATPDTDYELDALMVNGTTFSNGTSHTVTDNVTVKVTFKKKEVKPDPDPEPSPEPEPTVYYTVTLPAVEGAVTAPVAGAYEVESWGSFRFYLSLDKEYDRSTPVVTTSRGETITPRTSDGAYIIKYVRQPLDIIIDGIVKNPDPVANEELKTEGIRIYAANGYLHIQTPKPEKVYIFMSDGRLKTMLPVTDSGERIALPKGVYFVKAGERVYKTVL